MRKVKNCEIDYEADHWEEISIEALDLIEKLLVRDPAERMDAASLLKESWLHNKSVNDKFLGLRYECSEWMSEALKENIISTLLSQMV